MALKQYKNGQWREIGGVNHRVLQETKPISTLYQYKNGQMIPIWESGNLLTADGYIIVTKDNYIVTI